MPRHLPGFVPGHSGEIAPLMPISSSAKSKLFTPLKSRANSEQQERNKWQCQNGPRAKLGYCCLPPERVERTVNSKKETNGRIRMGQESKWAAVVYP